MTKYSELKTRIDEFKQKFIVPYNPLSAPNEYEFDVKAFCLLSHATFEEFFETVAIYALNESANILKNNARITKCLVYLLHSKCDENFEKEISKNTIKLYDYLLVCLKTIKQRYSHIINENHGITREKLFEIFWPIGVDLPTGDPRFSSISTFALQRGEYAHKGFIRNSITPQDAEIMVNDILFVAEYLFMKTEQNVNSSL